MVRAVVALLVVLGAALTLNAQEDECLGTGLTLDERYRLCDEFLPEDGRICLPSSTGELIDCDCHELLGLTRAAFNAKLLARDAVYLKRLDDLRKKPSIGQVILGRIIRPITNRDTLPLDGSILWEGNATCRNEFQLLAIIRNIAFMRNIGRDVIHSFTFKLVDSNERCMNIFQDTVPVISIPIGLVRYPKMTEELLVFMLLHEMGHRLTAEEYKTEYNADRWASTIGLSAYYGGALACELLPSIGEQFSAYYHWAYGEDDCWKSSCDRCGSSCYPKLTCRVKGIVCGYWNLINPIQGYPDSCWTDRPYCANSLTAAANQNPWGEDPCDGLFEPDAILTPDVATKLKSIETSLADLSVWKGHVNFGICQWRPELCSLDKDELFSRVRSDIESFDKRQRKILLRMDQTLEQLRSLKDDLRQKR